MNVERGASKNREDWVLPAVSKSGELWKVGSLCAQAQESRVTQAVKLGRD